MQTRFLVGRVLSERFTPETVPSSYLPPVYREMAMSSSRSNSVRTVHTKASFYCVQRLAVTVYMYVYPEE